MDSAKMLKDIKSAGGGETKSLAAIAKKTFLHGIS